MNGILLQDFKPEEARIALDQMHSEKALGPNCMTVGFYKKYWNTVGPDVTRLVLGFLNKGECIQAINHTNLVLIPKIKNPSTLKDYRLISLCNVSYKIISKVLANRLKVILLEIIDKSQSAFVQGRMIFDNIMVAHESVHSMMNKNSGGTEWLATKMDMSKAYDMVEWDYLASIMRVMGFASRWVDMIMACVRTVTYSTVINGRQWGHIIPSRGLRQGDPLSPYLFFIAAEGFLSLIKDSAKEGKLQGFVATRNGPKVMNLFFADDCLIFC